MHKELVFPPSYLNIRRELLPQIRSFDVDEFLVWIKKEHGINHKLMNATLGDLKASQGEFNADKVRFIMDNPGNRALQKPIIISSDNYILDGHHRFVAELNQNPPSKKISVVKINVKFLELIAVAKKFHKVGVRKIDENINTFMNRDVELVHQIISEGIQDKGIFKAVFMAGGMASGKDFVMNKILGGLPLKEISSDTALTLLMKKQNLSLLMPDEEEVPRALVRGVAKKITKTKEDLYIDGRLGLIINGTGASIHTIMSTKEKLEELGYETSMIFVNTTDAESKRRNVERGQKGGRTVPEKDRAVKWREAQQNIGFFQKIFSTFYVVDNSTNFNTASEEEKKPISTNFTRLYKYFLGFIAKPPKSPQAQAWMAAKRKEQGITRY